MNMGNWTDWRKIADKYKWYPDSFDWDGPACYELAIAGPKGGGLKVVYVGETKNEQKRIAAYASHGSHLSEIIDWHLKQGWILFYHAQAKESKAAAKEMQDNLLNGNEYPWNKQLNGVDDYE